jgi:hypothetical protein
VFRAPGPNTIADPAQDRGPVIMPKLFRRVTAWAVMNKAKAFTGNFVAYLAARSDECYTRTDFVEQMQAATTQHLADFIGPKNVLKAKPGDLVFKESPSKLMWATGPVTQW